ncbi:histidinol-phosphate transaminase [Bacteroidetes bacterium endosymbiont of Geopemphigus sp.]|uniref:histidinol-phosphate transaminase n=1 Tax=Bacteroidetes bacterium endosymbiont of Geopemphigus sp. TaxID=2047937 RepID=UPI000CD05215|nr:histidinol-phosphate transaminase [Bacteroidetes bacterium endosymbiont of Geopemphigus sp.]
MKSLESKRKKKSIRNFNIERLVRKNIRALKSYSSAREEFTAVGSIHLDANENSYGGPLEYNYHRYPDPLQKELKKKISTLKELSLKQIFLGNGSDEVIDLLYRVFCRPGKDHVIICPPTYGMYEVCAKINDVEVKRIPLQENFQLDISSILAGIDNYSRLIFICSPNNPTGNDFTRENVNEILEHFPGIMIIDEAYGDFSKQPSFIDMLGDHPNLVVVQTLSKAWGLAALRVGMAFAGETIIQWINKIKPPYNISGSTQELTLRGLEAKYSVDQKIRALQKERNFLTCSFLKFPDIIEKTYPSSANFLLVKTKAPKKIYSYLIQKGIVLRDRSAEELCEGCLRITVGTHKENQLLIEALENYQKS